MLDYEPAAVLRAVIEELCSYKLGKLLTASFRGFCKLFSDFDISMLLMDDSIASSTMILLVSWIFDFSPISLDPNVS